jgi:hypothetical protein
LDGSAGTSAGAPSEDSDKDGSRAIEEADIIKVEGGKLYALSQYGGLHVVDVSQRDKLPLLGRHKIVAMPFEMYVRGGIVYALYQGYGKYVHDEEAQSTSWVQTSEVVALDARNPASIKTLGEYEIPGYISDSRIVGDILYVAAYENGWCWGCGTTPRTNLISLNVKSPATISKVSELSFPEEENTYSWKRSLTATDQRIYVAGPVWGSGSPVGSTIQVIDISNPSGVMVEGATVEVAGQINSRWQMDEHEGVLRVVSQPFEWDLSVPPSVQTYTVVSSSEVTPLGEMLLQLPRAEQLMSARFDGTRGYAVTFERTDPLFTIDLTDPAKPVQMGELEMPGWLYHMDPRGNRLVALGFDQNNPEGAMTVSLFDVSDLSDPTMISRVNFGGDWAWVAEDQDRIHKAFNVLPVDELVLVPFSGWSYNKTNQDERDYYCGGSYQSGIQLVDWKNDALALRATVPTKATARRGFIYDQRLFSMSDERVETFDISDRDNPIPKAAVAMAQYVNRTLKAGNDVLRVGQNWWTQTTDVDIVSLADAGKASVDKLEVSSSDPEGCYSGQYLLDVVSSANRGYLLYQNYSYDPVTGKSSTGLRVVTLDTSGGVGKPTILGNEALDVSLGYSYYGYYGYGYGVVDRARPYVAIGSTLVASEQTWEYDDNWNYKVTDSSISVTDLADAKNPKTVRVPAFREGMASGLIASGSVVASSHYEVSATNASNVRFYLDRLDVSNPAAPVVLPKVNIPGSLLAFDAASSNLVTVDYRNVVETDVTQQQCYEKYGYNVRFEAPTQNYNWETTKGQCTALLYTLKLVKLGANGATIVGSVELGAGEGIGQVAQSEDRLFVSLANSGYYGYATSDCWGCASSFGESSHTIVTLGGLKTGQFAQGRLAVPSGDSWGYWYYWGGSSIVAEGNRAVLSTGWRGKLSVIDATNPASPSLVREAEYVGGWINDLAVVNGVAIASMGYDGVQTIRMTD